MSPNYSTIYSPKWIVQSCDNSVNRNYIMNDHRSRDYGNINPLQANTMGTNGNNSLNKKPRSSMHTFQGSTEISIFPSDEDEVNIDASKQSKHAMTAPLRNSNDLDISDVFSYTYKSNHFYD